MLLNENNPVQSLYVIGAEIISNLHEKACSVSELYDRCYKDDSVGFTLFLFALDWLFIIGIIDINEARIVKCT